MNDAPVHPSPKAGDRLLTGVRANPDAPMRGATEKREPGEHLDEESPEASKTNRDEPKQPDDQKAPSDEKKAPKNHRLRNTLLVVGAVLIALGGAAYWYYGTFFEETDDAQIDGYITNVAPRVPQGHGDRGLRGREYDRERGRSARRLGHE